MKNTNLSYSEIVAAVNAYKRSFKKAGMTAGKIYDLQNNFVITETYQLKEGNKILESHCEVIPASYYLNCLTWIALLGDRVYKTFTAAGTICTKIISTSPDGKQKAIRNYSIAYKA